MKFLKKILLLFLCFSLIIIGGLLLYIKLSPKIIINSANKITLYDKNNKPFFSRSNDNEWADLNEISDYLIKATIYTEDKNFYKHFGFDFIRIGSALYNNILTKSTSQGASTITQQYAKNMFLNFDKTWKRKWDEALYTIRIEANYSKDEILEGYLNTINYGHGKYGIKEASKFYFNKDCKDLSLGEASMLAGIPKSPNNYSPIKNMNLAKKRQKYILKNMNKMKVITDDEMKRALSEDIKLSSIEDRDNLSSINYYVDAVINELNSIDSIPKNYGNMGGLKIYTEFDLEAQTNLEKNVNDAFDDNTKIQTSSVLMNPTDGSIIALIGGRDYNKSSYNRAIDSKRQVGSTMKPYLYYAALENGFTASTAFISERTTFSVGNNKTYSPQNYNNIYGDKAISMATAIAYSDNIYAIKTHLFLGEDTLINLAKRVGINEKLDKVPSLPLGTNEINIINMAAGYSAFANLGYKVKGHFINNIKDSNGKTIYKRNNDKNLVLNPSLVYILNNILTSTYDPMYIDYNYPTAISLNGKLNHIYALKSGTTNGDNWNIGYNSKILCAVWVGYDDNTELTKSDYKYAQRIWYNTVENYEKDFKNDDVWYDKPDNVIGMLVEPISGKPSNDIEKNKKIIYFLKGTEPKGDEPVFDEIEKN